MSNKRITEADLLAAVFAELDASLPKPIQPDEFSVSMYRNAHPGMSVGQAKARINFMVEAGLIEKIPEKRITQGGVAFAYRLLHKTA